MERWRLDRLRRVANMARAYSRATGATTLEQALHRLHDHKGDLTAVWKVPDPTLQRYVGIAWERENECNLEHLTMVEYQSKLWEGRLDPAPQDPSVLKVCSLANFRRAKIYTIARLWG
jgi:hypothetical protein